MLLLAAALAALILWLTFEKYRHIKNLENIPIRIHVNGTRGKSTVTRLIAAGLRGAGIKVLAKTTGTSPREIFEDGSEAEIRRRGRATVREQIRFIAQGARRGAEAIVIESMAVRPEIQWVSEHHIVRSHIGVITNIREDHG
ncbi:MAG: Mur ligase family protein, partial [Thermodesulfobacteriota bacterium]